MLGVMSCNTPIFEFKHESRVNVLVYKETIHSLGGATETGVANVTIFMDVSPALSTIGHANDQTGMLSGGGGGMDGDANPTRLFLNNDDNA